MGGKKEMRAHSFPFPPMSDPLNLTPPCIYNQTNIPHVQSQYHHNIITAVTGKRNCLHCSWLLLQYMIIVSFIGGAAGSWLFSVGGKGVLIELA